MKKYYVVEKDDEDWDFDSTPSYNSQEEAFREKERCEQDYGIEYVVWEVD